MNTRTIIAVQKSQQRRAGHCPKCNSTQLFYDAAEIHDESIEYPYECENCEFRGAEWADIIFSEHRDEDGNVV